MQFIGVGLDIVNVSVLTVETTQTGEAVLAVFLATPMRRSMPVDVATILLNKSADGSMAEEEVACTGEGLIIAGEVRILPDCAEFRDDATLAL